MSGPKTSQLEIERMIRAQLEALRSDVDHSRARARRRIAALLNELLDETEGCAEAEEAAASLRQLAEAALAQLTAECAFTPATAMAESVARAERCSSRAAAIADAFEREAHPLAERIQRARAQAAAASEARDFTAVLAKAAKDVTAAAVEAARSFMADEHCLPSESSAVEAQGGSRSAPMEKAAAEGTAMQVEPVGQPRSPLARCCGRKRDIDRPQPCARGRPSGARAHRLPLHPACRSRPAPGNGARAGPAGRRAAGASAPHHGIERRSHGRSYRPHRGRRGRPARPERPLRGSVRHLRYLGGGRRPPGDAAGPPTSSRSQRLPEGLHRRRYGTPRLHHRPLGHYGARPHGHPSALRPRRRHRGAATPSCRMRATSCCRWQGCLAASRQWKTARS